MQLKHGQFCKIKNTTIFGTYAGQVENINEQSWFFDEELNEFVKVATKRLMPIERYK